MNFTQILTPVWSDTAHTSINCLATFDTIGQISFTASQSDTEVHGKEIYNRCIAEEFGAIAPFVPAIISNSELAISTRAKRDALLAGADWSQLADVPQVTKDKWAPYRQALRDVPTQASFPANIIWPVIPQA